MTATRHTLNMDSDFSFACGRCSACCRDRLIRINPYEIARLSHGFGISTTEFIRKYTRDNGIHLLNKNDGTCTFLDKTGCSVHANRPFVCRLFPLGRHEDQHGNEQFRILPLHKFCKGVPGKESTVKEYLHTQGAMNYYWATLCYLDLLFTIVPSFKDEIREYHLAQDQGIIESDNNKKEMPDFMDIDRALGSMASLPEEPWEKTMHHIRIIEHWYNQKNMEVHNE